MKVPLYLEAGEWAGDRLLSEPILKLAIEYAQLRNISLESARWALRQYAFALRSGQDPKSVRKEMLEKSQRKEGLAKLSSLVPRAIPSDPRLFNWLVGRERRREIYDEIHDLLPCKVLVLSDLHIPYCDYNALWRLVESHEDAAVCVINGDYFEAHNLCYALTLPRDDLLAEFQRGRELLKDLSKCFKRIYVSLGNHEMRFGRAIRKIIRNMPQEGEVVRLLLEELTSKESALEGGSIVELLCSKDQVAKYSYGFFLIAGKAVIGHPGDFSSEVAKTVVWMRDSLDNWSPELGVEDYETVVGSHTHHVANIMHRRKQLIEPGCLVHTMDYPLRGKFGAAGRKDRWYKGGAFISLKKDGGVDVNHTGYFLVEDPF